MGCGGSKLEPEQEARLRPILRRRLEEFLTRRNGDISKKQLLQNDGAVSHGSEREEEGDEEEIIINKEDKAPRPPSASDDDHSSLLIKDNPPTDQKINIISQVSFRTFLDDNEDSSIMKNYNNEIKCEDNKGDNIDNEAKILLNGVEKPMGSSKEEEDECTFDDHEKMGYTPGSPSFRVYCVHSLDEQEELDGTYFILLSNMNRGLFFIFMI